jgi:3-phosphoshikimate 1-carboxyvinyltransferase
MYSIEAIVDPNTVSGKGVSTIIVVVPSWLSTAEVTFLGCKSSAFTVESDWSGASYWFGFVALSEKAEVILSGLKLDSLQGDNRIIEIMDPLGVRAKFIKEGLLLTKKESHHSLEYDFSDCPDLGQTVAVTCAAKGIKGEFTGLESLRIKETDRIAALQNELGKIGARLDEIDGKLWVLHPATSLGSASNISIETYDDHRMAMAFAPLATQMNITILNPTVVNKSYPSFWKHLQKAGFELYFTDNP